MVVELEHDAFLVCVTHALTTEKEEVMGLLLGDIYERDGNTVNHIWDVIILRRSCKQRDRVEISAEQLAAASEEAENLSQQTGKNTRVVGWYHSHPHITVLPSHVDIGTQATYQMMDKDFIGLIFSVFNKDKDNKGRIQAIAFQSKDTSNEPFDFSGEYPIHVEESTAPNGLLEVPMYIIPPTSSSSNVFSKLVALQEILLEEERDTYITASKSAEQHPFQISYNKAIFEKALCCLLEYGFYPLSKLLEDKKAYYQELLTKREREKIELEKELLDLQKFSDDLMSISPK